jgi:hypothetical protein
MKQSSKPIKLEIKAQPSRPNKPKNKQKQKKTRTLFRKTDTQLAQDAQRNADCYVQQLLDPFGDQCLARKPSPMPYPTSVHRTTLRYDLSSVVDTGGVESTRLCIFARPFATKTTQIMTAFNSTAGTATFVASDLPNLGVMLNNFALWRCVGLGVRFFNEGALLNRNGVYYVTRFVQGVDAPSPTEWRTSFPNSPFTKVIDAASLPEDGIIVPWIPLTDQSNVYDTARATSNQPTGSSFTYPAAASAIGEDQWIVISWAGEGGSSTNKTHVDITHIWETVPFQSTAFLYDTECVMGSPGNVSTSFEKAASANPQVVPNGTSFSGIVDTQLGSFDKGVRMAHKAGSLIRTGMGLAAGAQQVYAAYRGVAGAAPAAASITNQRYALKYRQLELDFEEGQIDRKTFERCKAELEQSGSFSIGDWDDEPDECSSCISHAQRPFPCLKPSSARV